jgi:hypothetical protein
MIADTTWWSATPEPLRRAAVQFSTHQVSDQGHRYRNRPLSTENSTAVAPVLL